jgi:DNA-binding GntR family transcriptional regulator
MKQAFPHLTIRILEVLQTERLKVGDHVTAQGLADRLAVSRTPVNVALGELHGMGLLERRPNRGYFIALPVAEARAGLQAQLQETAVDVVSNTYFRLADDRLRGALPDSFTESWLRSAYGLSASQGKAVLLRMAEEGWVQKKTGYGWVFTPMLTTPESLLQSYRLRVAIEPAALLEPGYRVDHAAIERCRAAEHHLLHGGIQTASADHLHDRGVTFHETLVEGSGNPFFIETVRRVNRVRRLLSYRSMQDRHRYRAHCEQHLHLLDLVAQGRMNDAADAMRSHLHATVDNLSRLRTLLTP